MFPQLITALCARANVPVENNNSIPKILVRIWTWTDPTTEAAKVAARAEGRVRAVARMAGEDARVVEDVGTEYSAGDDFGVDGLVQHARARAEVVPRTGQVANWIISLR